MKYLKMYVAAVLAILFWGLSFIWSGRLVGKGIPVEYFLPVRIFLAAVLLLGYNLLRGYSLRIRKQDLLTFLMLAACEPFIYFFCETYGIQFTGSPTISSLVPQRLHHHQRGQPERGPRHELERQITI